MLYAWFIIHLSTMVSWFSRLRCLDIVRTSWAPSQLIFVPHTRHTCWLVLSESTTFYFLPTSRFSSTSIFMWFFIEVFRCFAKLFKVHHCFAETWRISDFSQFHRISKGCYNFFSTVFTKCNDVAVIKKIHLELIFNSFNF